MSEDSADERLNGRYLRLLRDAVLGEHYLENELRIEHLLTCVSNGAEPDAEKLADPALNMQHALRRVEMRLERGDLPQNAASAATSLALSDVGRYRLDHLERCVALIREEEVAGDMVDAGSQKAGAAIYLRGILEAHGVNDSRVWMVGTFRRSIEAAGEGRLELPGDLNNVRQAFARFDLLDGVSFLQGPPARTLEQAPIGEVALLRIDGHDADLVEALLEALYDKVADGGFVIVDDYGHEACEEAVDRFRSARDVPEPLERIDASAVSWRKSVTRTSALPRSSNWRKPGEPETAQKDLSVVIVVYNMRREAARTLHSLSRSYQRGIEDVDYEVIVVENGSEPDQRLHAEFVEGFGAEFRLLDLGGDADPSPAKAINAGIAMSSGRAVAIMIDGAHVLTPGVLRQGLLGLSAYAPAVATVKQWYVGPGQQPQALAEGYDKDYEDRLFDLVDWPSDGYRLFEVGHFIGPRDWFDGDWESNCIFVPRALLEQAGGMDESFSMPGGGFVNLDLYDRAIATPGVTNVTLLGEGSFHQLHGGTTTNVEEPGKRGGLIHGYGRHFAELRGRPFMIPAQETHYVGSLPASARRTRRRAMSAEAFRLASTTDADRRASRPAPVPEELKAEFIDAVWRSDGWRNATWLGTRTHRLATDLLVYQELLFRVRPEWIIETRTGSGGRAHFLASVCELMGHGNVLSLDAYPLAGRPEHERITYVEADPAVAGTADEVRGIVGGEPNAIVILGAAGGRQVTAAFNHLSPFVPISSYVVFEDTVLDAHAVWPSFGSGPRSAIAPVLASGDFVADPSLERYALTFNPGGFLKRVR